jgi:hypothetical protein
MKVEKPYHMDGIMEDDDDDDGRKRRIVRLGKSKKYKKKVKNHENIKDQEENLEKQFQEKNINEDINDF